MEVGDVVLVMVAVNVGVPLPVILGVPVTDTVAVSLSEALAVGDGLLVTEYVAVWLVDVVDVIDGVRVAVAVGVILAAVVIVSEGVRVVVCVSVPEFVIVIDDERLLDAEALTDQLSVPDFVMLLVALKVTGPAAVVTLAVMVSVSEADGEKFTDCVREPVVTVAVILGVALLVSLALMLTEILLVSEELPDTTKTVLECSLVLAEADAISDSLVVAEGIGETDASAELMESLLGGKLNVGEDSVTPPVDAR